MNPYDAFVGFKLVENPFLVEYHLRQFRFPKSKSKRIRTKWRRRSKNFKTYEVPMPSVFYVDHEKAFVAHPKIIALIKKNLPKPEAQS